MGRNKNILSPRKEETLPRSSEAESQPQGRVNQSLYLFILPLDSDILRGKPSKLPRSQTWQHHVPLYLERWEKPCEFYSLGSTKAVVESIIVYGKSPMVIWTYLSKLCSFIRFLCATSTVSISSPSHLPQRHGAHSMRIDIATLKKMQLTTSLGWKYKMNHKIKLTQHTTPIRPGAQWPCGRGTAVGLLSSRREGLRPRERRPCAHLSDVLQFTVFCGFLIFLILWL